ncbi:hypothetical protein [Celeribacter litoreus]|uniref:hypothetical protein n=1 Tax=Celeribacter litoreus TaxID=2876714 RepID=UPI001CCE2D6F|nr:hypothetical protein [Celeribacter litoreus]MCA0044640.1 hypothetical protein [Celeribacter litoreus]
MLKRTLLALALVAPLSAPIAAFAECSGEQKTASCADGYMWDKDARTCVKQVVG